MDIQNNFNQPTQPSPVPITPAPSGTRWGIILGIVAFALAIGAGAYWGFVKKYDVATSPTPTASVDATAEWKTYTNTQYGIELKYPADFISTPWTGSGAGLGETNLLSVRQQDGVHAAIMGITIYPQGSFTIPFINKFQPTGPSAPTIVHVGNNQFYFYGAGGGGIGYADQYFFNANGRLVVINFYEVNQQDRSPSASTQQLEQQILSTFKFISSTVGWTNYTNRDGYTVQYPSTWEILIAEDNNSIIKWELRDKKYSGNIEWPGLTLDNEQDIEGLFKNAPTTTSFSSVQEVHQVRRINYPVNGKVFHASCAIYGASGMLFLCDQILSTFKFTDSTAGWKTYTSQALNIVFKYPPDWVVREGNDYPGTAQGEDYIKITKGANLIFSGSKTECLAGSTYCKTTSVGLSFSTVSTDIDVKKIIDAVVGTVTRIR